MTYREIFRELYVTNKGKIKFYVIFLTFLVVSLGNSNYGYIWASSDFLSQQQTNQFGGFMAMVFTGVANASGFAIDPITIMALEAAYVLFSPLLPDQYAAYISYTGLMQFKVVSVLVLLWFVAAKLLRSFNISRIAGLSVEMLENVIGRFNLFALCIVQFLYDPQVGMQAMASNGLVSQESAVGYSVWGTCVILGVVCIVLISYTVMRTVAFAGNVLLLPLLGVPFSSVFIESIKTFSVISALYLAFTNPVLFFICFIIGLLICLCLFRKAYVLTRYFKEIYAKPFLAKVIGCKKSMPLIAPGSSDKLRAYLADEDVRLLIPVYAVKKVNGFPFLKKYDKWWLVVTETQKFICKTQFLKKHFHKIELHNEERDKIFINQVRRFYEIFNLRGSEEDVSKKFTRVKKKFHFVYSREYDSRFKEIQEITGFVDYKIYKKTLADNQKMSRKGLKEKWKRKKWELLS